MNNSNRKISHSNFNKKPLKQINLIVLSLDREEIRFKTRSWRKTSMGTLQSFSSLFDKLFMQFIHYIQDIRI